MTRNWKKIYEEFLASLSTETMKASYRYEPVLDSMNRLQLDSYKAYSWYYGRERKYCKEEV